MSKKGELVMSKKDELFICPKCGSVMIYYANQGPMGGHKCPHCGLQIDDKN